MSEETAVLEVIEEEYEVYNIYLAAFFDLYGVTFVRTFPSVNGYQNTFVFRGERKKLEKMKFDYFAGKEYTISPHRLFERFKTMRNVTT